MEDIANQGPIVPAGLTGAPCPLPGSACGGAWGRAIVLAVLALALVLALVLARSHSPLCPLPAWRANRVKASP